ncbi:ATP-dependent DNA helicase RecG [Actinoplanes tereljensis]|uniref:ATP-dependent DNA helicase n=1 Tax=Paractinoplanes tereljensis TaxID=571912 RepID=A0A919TWK2_9ACTN|nr:ATP-binding protein [Actinoplanes tereljensis]GIF25221.1 ATP-dependent DNA helicase [Actinoplanes tereljensis]
MIDVHARYEATEFAELIARETDEVELKTGTSADRLQEAIVAFSNTDGGVIFIGVTDKREVVGRRLDQGTDDKIHQAALAAHDAGRYDIREVEVDGKPIVAVRVRRREEGFAQTSDGRILVRRGGRNIPLFGAEAWSFMSSRTLRRFERSLTHISVQAADHAALIDLCLTYGWDPTDPQLGNRLSERGLATDGELTVAGALFLTHPSDSLDLKKAVIEVRRYPAEGPNYDRRVVFDGTLPQQVREATGFIIGELGSDIVVSGLYRYEMPRIPDVVIREAIANAVAHRTYEINRTAVVVELRPDAVTVRSPGPLPEPVTIETIRQAQAARNPDLIDVLRRFSLAEDAGRGIDVMQDEMEDALLDPPMFEDDGSFVTVTLPLRGAITPRERVWVAELERRGEISSSDKLLLVYAARGNELTNSSARAVLKTDDPGVARKALKRLCEANLLEQRGERRGSVYYLNESVSPPAAFRLSPKQLSDMILEAAATEDEISNERVRELTGLDRQQAISVLRALVRDGRLVQTGERRGTRYILPPGDNDQLF